MNKFPAKIKTVIIDDDEDFIISLGNNLKLFPEIEITGFASKYRHARNILHNDHFDLLFLDIEMPGKNGFELLEECRNAGKNGFSVIFHTAYDKYVIQALRESAIDYILKPVKPDELRSAIDRFKKIHQYANKQMLLPKPTFQEIIALPTATGIRFTDKSSIIMFNWNCGGNFEKKCWTAVLTDRSEIKLKSGTSATDILGNMGQTAFIRISPSVILNIGYIAAIDYATRECQLLQPFNDIRVTVSRSNLAEIRDKFDLL
jgi:two-component system LytT family response regulator